MSTNRRNRFDNRDQEERIAELKRAAQEVGGDMTSWESDTLTPDESARFWRRVAEHEAAPETSNFQQLLEAGLELVEPGGMDDEHVTSKLWEVIGALARMRVFISQTNHLSDRELYTLLWRDVLREETPMLPDGANMLCHVDLLSTGSAAHTYLYLKYYADEDWRRQWLADFPDYDMPAHEDPPYDRDRALPPYIDEAPERTM